MQVSGYWWFRRDEVAPEPFYNQFRDVEIRMADLVDLAIPANAQAAADALGLKVHRSVTSGARVRQIPREEAEIAVECCAIGAFLPAFWRTPWTVRGHEQEKGPSLVCLSAMG
jgi:hypothetical protein